MSSAAGTREYGSARTYSADDQGKEKPTLLFFRRASIGTNSLNTILPSSRLLLPVLPRPLPGEILRVAVRYTSTAASFAVTSLPSLPNSCRSPKAWTRIEA
jgi:hypothetical protein